MTTPLVAALVGNGYAGKTSRSAALCDGYHREPRAAEGSPAGPTEPERCDRRVASDRRSWIDRRVAAAHGTHRATAAARTNLR